MRVDLFQTPVSESERNLLIYLGAGYESIFDLHLRWKGEEDVIRVYLYTGCSDLNGLRVWRERSGRGIILDSLPFRIRYGKTTFL